MKRAALCIVATVTLAACEGAPAAPPSARPVAPSFAAVRSKTNMSVPVELAVFVQCANGGAGELVQLTGPLHVVSQVTISSSGHMSVYSHFQPQGITGTGLVTGNKYQGTGVTEFKNTFGGPFPVTSTFVNNFYMIGQGPGNNFRVHETIHLTINANGEPTASIDNFRTTCK